MPVTRCCAHWLGVMACSFVLASQSGGLTVCKRPLPGGGRSEPGSCNQQHVRGKFGHRKEGKCCMKAAQHVDELLGGSVPGRASKERAERKQELPRALSQSPTSRTSEPGRNSPPGSHRSVPRVGGQAAAQGRHRAQGNQRSSRAAEAGGCRFPLKTEITPAGRGAHHATKAMANFNNARAIRRNAAAPSPPLP